MSLFADGRIVFVKNFIEAGEKHEKLIKVTKYKIKIQKTNSISLY